VIKREIVVSAMCSMGGSPVRDVVGILYCDSKSSELLAVAKFFVYRMFASDKSVVKDDASFRSKELGNG